jgi:hypothetical protein
MDYPRGLTPEWTYWMSAVQVSRFDGVDQTIELVATRLRQGLAGGPRRGAALDVIRSSFQMPQVVLKEAIRAVPAVKYPLGIAGVASALAIVTELHTNLAVAGLGTVAMLVLITILALFARLAEAGDEALRKPMLVFVWAALTLVLVVAGLLVSCVFFHRPLDLASLVEPISEHHLSVSNLHADCSQNGFCMIEVELMNKGRGPERITGFKYQLIDFKLLGTLGGLQQPDVLGDLDLSDQSMPSKSWRYAHREAVDVVDPGQGRSLVLKVTARDLATGFGVWTLRPVLETSAGDLPLKDVQLMLPHWDAVLLSHGVSKGD